MQSTLTWTGMGYTVYLPRKYVEDELGFKNKDIVEVTLKKIEEVKK